MVDEIVAAFDAFEASPDVRAVVVTGAAPAFCAGADLSHLGGAGGAGDGGARAGLRRIYEGFLRVSRCSLPTIAAVNGAAVGAGMNLALACDVRLAGASARFDTRFLQLGIHPGGGHTWMLERAVGPQAAAATVLFGEVLTAADAERVGLVWRTVPDEELADVARSLAERAGAAPASCSCGRRPRSSACPTWRRTPKRSTWSSTRRSGRSVSPSSRPASPRSRSASPAAEAAGAVGYSHSFSSSSRRWSHSSTVSA